jgi:sortase A
MTSRIPLAKPRLAKPHRRKSALARAAYFVFLSCGVLALAYCGYVVAAAHFYQAIQKSRFESVRTVEAHHPALEGNAIGVMKIARLGMDAIFVQGDSPKILRHAVGHIAETALPGEPGNVVLTAHRDSFFRPLRDIRQGDMIELKTLDGEFAYRVDWTKAVSPSDIEVLQSSHENTLTLVTCFPFYYVGPAPKRFIVRAHQIGPVPTQSSVDEAQVHL